MTNQIADELQKEAKVKGAIVVLEGEHLCLSMRGPRSNGLTLTSAIRGSFNDPLTKSNALELMAKTGALIEKGNPPITSRVA